MVDLGFSLPKRGWSQRVCVCVIVLVLACGFLPTRQSFWQVDVAVLYREVHPLIGRAQQAPAGEDWYCNVWVLLTGGGMQLNENQVTHHHWLRLWLVAESVKNERRTKSHSDQAESLALHPLFKISLKAFLLFSINNRVPSICCSVLWGIYVAPVALEAPVHEHQVFSATLEPAGSPMAPHSSAEKGGLHLHPCTMQTEFLWKDNA